MSDGPRCRGCHRRLKYPSPSGYGPVCERRHNGTPPGRAGGPGTRPTTAIVPIDGQAELPLEPMQPTLWSL